MRQLISKLDLQQQTNSVRQVEFQLETNRVTLHSVLMQKSMNEAIILCVSNSGLDRKKVYGSLGIDPATWSRIESGQANFPVNQLAKLMIVCGNLAPLMWLVEWCGFDWVTVRHRQTEVEKRAAALTEENQILRRMLKLRAEAEV